MWAGHWLGVGIYKPMYLGMGFPGGSERKESACNVGGLGLIPGLGRSAGEGNGYPLRNSCLENPMDRGAWRAAVHGVTKSWTQLSIAHTNITNILSYRLFIFYSVGQII